MAGQVVFVENAMTPTQDERYETTILYLSEMTDN